MSLSRDQEHQEKDPGSDDRDLHSPKDYAARYVLRHAQLPTGKARS
ncbi:MAG TPA: hypothetical protein VF838_16915 [Trebonia sp.]